MIDLGYRGSHVVFKDEDNKSVYVIRDILPLGDNETQLILTDIDTDMTIKARGSDLKPYNMDRVTRQQFNEAMQATIAGYSFAVGEECLHDRMSSDEASVLIDTAIELLADLNERLFND